MDEVTLGLLELYLQLSQWNKIQPLSILFSLLSWKLLLHVQTQSNTPTHTHASAHIDTHSQVEIGQGCSPSLRRLTTETSFSRSLGSYKSFEESQGPLAKGFFSFFFIIFFQGKMPRAIVIKHSNWMEKAHVLYWGLKEVKAKRNASKMP